MQREDGFKNMAYLQELYCTKCKWPSFRHSSQYESMLHAFLAAAVAFSEWKTDQHELDVWLDLNNITVVDDVDAIESIAKDAIDMVMKKSSYLVPEYINIDYIIPMKNLLKIIEERNSISS